MLWPEFSWETVIGEPSSRCYQRFAHDISRAGYDDAGRIYSIICPQQGAYSPLLGDLNIEVTVTGQRGWVNEDADCLDYDLVAADMKVVGKIWFGPLAKDKPAYRLLKMILEHENLPFPVDKANAIHVRLHRVGDPDQHVIQVRSGVSGDFPNPSFAMHHAEAWAVANVAVQIGPIHSHQDAMVDDFNAMVMDIFNLAAGNLLTPGNILTWNVWVDAPTIVDQAEWRAHAEKWRHSIDTGHAPPRRTGLAKAIFQRHPLQSHRGDRRGGVGVDQSMAEEAHRTGFGPRGVGHRWGGSGRFQGALFGHIESQFSLVGVRAESDAAAGTIRILEPVVV